MQNGASYEVKCAALERDCVLVGENEYGHDILHWKVLLIGGWFTSESCLETQCIPNSFSSERHFLFVFSWVGEGLISIVAIQ